MHNVGRWHVIQARSVNQQGDIVGVGLGPNGHAYGVLLRLETAD